MKLLKIFLILLIAVPVFAQKKCPNPPEVIPHSAVEPAVIDNKAACPRDEYELKWFVVEDERAGPNGMYYFSSGSGGLYSSPNTGAKKVLVFKPMCVVKEQS